MAERTAKRLEILQMISCWGPSRREGGCSRKGWLILLEGIKVPLNELLIEL